MPADPLAGLRLGTCVSAFLLSHSNINVNALLLSFTAELVGPVRLSLIGKLWQSFPSLLFSGKTLEVKFDVTALLQNTELFVDLPIIL